MKAREIAEQNEYLLQRQRQFRTAADYVGEELALVSCVEKIVLFGSVVRKLEKEIPRFREFRREGIAVFHECKDVDLAVWLNDLRDLKSLQRANVCALKRLLSEKRIGVAHHQVDIFIMEPGTNRYLGRLCSFGTCPRKGKRECLVPECGATPLLQRHADFHFGTAALKEGEVVVLFQRGPGDIPAEKAK